MIAANEEAKVPVALVGGGTIAPQHAKYLLSSPTCQLVGIIDPFPPGQELAKTLSIPHYSHVSELLSKGATKPEAYVVCVPSGLHVQVSTELLHTATPKAILVEKPFSTDSSSGAQLLALAAAKSCTIAVGHHRRFHPAVAAAKATLAAGALGALTAVSGVWTCRKNPSYYTAAPWRVSRAAGGGPIWTNFVHDVDLLHYLVGAHVSRVWATNTARRRHHATQKPDDKVEEGAAVMLQFANGVVGSFVVCDNVASPYGWEAASREARYIYAGAPVNVDTYRLFGTQGTLTVPDGNLWTYKTEEAEKRGLEVGWNIPMHRDVVEKGEEVPFQQQVEHLARLVRGLEAPVCPGADGLAVVKVCEAIIEALDTADGMPIDIK